VKVKKPASVLSQDYTTNTWEFTTNAFRAFDVPLTNGANLLTFHATDLTSDAFPVWLSIFSP
jgi:hypothetical protein